MDYKNSPRHILAQKEHLESFDFEVLFQRIEICFSPSGKAIGSSPAKEGSLGFLDPGITRFDQLQSSRQLVDTGIMALNF